MTGNLKVDAEIIRLIDAGHKVSIVAINRLSVILRGHNISDLYVIYPLDKTTSVFRFTRRGDEQWYSRGHSRDADLDVYVNSGVADTIESYEDLKAQMDKAR